ncbi:hypothetical protein TB1_043535 [Malus domestica]
MWIRHSYFFVCLGLVQVHLCSVCYSLATVRRRWIVKLFRGDGKDDSGNAFDSVRSMKSRRDSTYLEPDRASNAPCPPWMDERHQPTGDFRLPELGEQG